MTSNPVDAVPFLGEDLENLRVVAMEYASKVSNTIDELLSNTDKILAYLKTGQVAENDGPADSESL